jgi:hypothetical protein
MVITAQVLEMVTTIILATITITSITIIIITRVATMDQDIMALLNKVEQPQDQAINLVTQVLDL